MDRALRELCNDYGLQEWQKKSLHDDGLLSVEEAIGDTASVPKDCQQAHEEMRPLLRVVSVLHHCYDFPSERWGGVRVGQIVCHHQMVPIVELFFVRLFRLGFPLQSCIPQSWFGNNDAESMRANNSSCYRPEWQAEKIPSEHFRGLAIDLNPAVNPFYQQDEHGNWNITPENCSYNSEAIGAIKRQGDVHQLAIRESFEWGGNWGDPCAYPSDEFIVNPGRPLRLMDYQHLQPNDWLLRAMEFQLPPSLRRVA